MPKPDPNDAIAELLRRQGSLTSGDLARLTGLSRQALHRHLRRAVEHGLLVREGAGRSTRYRSSEGPVFDRSFATKNLQEDRVSRDLDAWLDELGPDRSDGADAILAYTVTELVNNAIDHSGAPTVHLRARITGDRIQVQVEDEGIGAFENARARLGLEDHLHALQEISKGKTTTLPERHAGEGLFFTSKMVDRFELTANGLTWIADNTIHDQTVRAAEDRPGTHVRIEIAAMTSRTSLEVFERYTHDLAFDRTRCVIRLFESGTSFISRSEAKRLLANLDRFREVILDFHGVKAVGQGFVDEVFRVWARAHPEVRFIPTDMSPPVEFMVRRGLPRGPREG